jgi:hypothetical protein
MKRRGQTVYSAQDRVHLLSIPEPNSGCWLWIGTGRTNPSGLEYGRLVFGSRSDGSRRSVSAHRLSYTAFKGEIPTGMNVLHKCDVPFCVNPDHLFLGTQGENMQDCLMKGRVRNWQGLVPPPPGDDT